MIEQLYQSSIHDVDLHRYLIAAKVLPFMERFCYENQARAPVVWNCLEQAIQNAIATVRDLNVDDIEEKELEVFQSVVGCLLSACIRTRAITAVYIIARLYELQPGLLSDNMASLETLVQRMNEAPKVHADTMTFYSIRDDFGEL